jgi:hypothetical protein
LIIDAATVGGDNRQLGARADDERRDGKDRYRIFGAELRAQGHPADLIPAD